MKTRKPEKKEEVTTELPVEEGLTFADMLTLNAALSSVKNKGLSVESIKTVVRLKIRLKEEVAAVQSMQEAIMEKYDVSKTDTGYSFKDHPKYKEIIKELETLQQSKVSVKGLNSVPEEEVYASTPDVSSDVLVILIEKLAKK